MLSKQSWQNKVQKVNMQAFQLASVGLCCQVLIRIQAQQPRYSHQAHYRCLSAQAVQQEHGVKALP